MTILGPLLMGGLIAGFAYLSMNQGDSISMIRVVDENSEFLLVNSPILKL